MFASEHNFLTGRPPSCKSWENVRTGISETQHLSKSTNKNYHNNNWHLSEKPRYVSVCQSNSSFSQSNHIRHALMISKVQREFKHNLRLQTPKQTKNNSPTAHIFFIILFIFHNHLLFKTRSNIKSGHIYQHKIKQQSSMC